MNEFKIGGKITLDNNTSYRIIDIIKEKDLEYYFCSTTEKPIEPKVFIKKEENGKIFMGEIIDKKILQKIAFRILK